MHSKAPLDWQRLSALFDELVELSPEEQRARLDSLELDEQARAELEQLLVADQADAGVLERGGEIIEGWSDSGDAEQGHESMTGRRIGRWVLDEPLGHGGSAVVYRAHRHDGFDQVAALKLLTLGSLASQRQHFFERERHFLARLKHPHIATLLDGGVTEDGTPYLVTELVRGEPLDVYSQLTEPDLDTRLDLFLDICDTVAFAHRQLVVHRDLKPSNILVDEEAHIHLLDFGIAKLLGDSEATKTVAAFTPAYAAPEQWFGEPASTATDVYSLGLILYELCTGEPLESAGGASGSPGSFPPIMSRAEDVTISFPKEQRRLDRDLQSILELALRLDAGDRYPDARSLAEDVRRWRGGHPIEARPTGRMERASKFLRRNPLASAASALALTALLALVVISTWQSGRIAQQRDLARSEADKAKQTIELLQDFLASADPEMEGRDLTVLELLEAFEPRLGSIDDPLIRANLLHTYGTTYEGLGELADAQRFMEQALSVRQSQLGAHHEETLLASTDLSVIYFIAGELELAETLARSTLEAARSSLGPEHPVALDATDNLGTVLVARGDPATAADLHREALDIRTRVFGGDAEATVTSKNGLAFALLRLGRANEAETLFAETLEQNRRAFGDDHPRTLAAMNNLAMARGTSGDFQGAVPIFREVTERLKASLGENHPRAMVSAFNLAAVTSRNGDHAEAEELLLELARRQAEKLGEEHPNTLATRLVLASTWRHLGRAERAVALASEITQIRREVSGVAHPGTLNAVWELAQALNANGRRQEAIGLLRQAIEDSVDANIPQRESLIQLLADLQASPAAGE